MRWRTQRCLRVLCLAVFCAFLTLQLVGVIVHNQNHSGVHRSNPESLISPLDIGSQTNEGEVHGVEGPMPPPAPKRGKATPSVESSQKAKDDLKLSAIDIQANESLAGERSHGLPESNDVAGFTVKPSEVDIPHVLEQIKELNAQQSVRNMDILGPIDNGTVVIAIQVHNRLQYLRQLIASLSQARHIEKTLLVFSHDYWDPAINTLIASIDFAKYIQIFYPYSIQTHPNEFPGESPNDCPRDATKELAKNKMCVNARWPDLYGHYREAKFTQTKHHWWWKGNRIFDQLSITKHHTGLVLFLEEDHHVAEDFLHVLDLTYSECKANRQNCDIICLGTYLKHINYQRQHKNIPNAVGFMGMPGHHPIPIRHRSKRGVSLSLSTTSMSSDFKGQQPLSSVRGLRQLLWNPASLLSSVLDVFSKDFQPFPGGPVYSTRRQNVETTQWVSAKHNMGMAFDREIWQKLHHCRAEFCSFDDYNWDWSLQHLSISCLPEKLQVMLVKAPRVFHIGECGVHHKKKECQTSKVVSKVQEVLKAATQYLYPREISVTRSILKKKSKTPKGNGGWGDLRDQALCMNMGLPVVDQDDIEHVLIRAQSKLN